MTRNESQLDRYIRIGVGALIVIVGIVLGSWWGLLGAVVLITGVVGFCPIYRLLGVSTLPDADKTGSDSGTGNNRK